MRVLLANKFLYPKGGAERAVLDLGAGLERRGHQVFWFGMDHPDNIVPPETSALVPRRDYRTGGLRRYRDAVAMIHSTRARREMASFLARMAPDVIHAHNIYHQLTPTILDAARQAGIPVVMTLHDYKLVCPRYDLLRHGEPCDRCVEGGPLACLRHRCAGSWGSSMLLTCEAIFHRSRGSYDAVGRFLAPSRFLQRVMIRGGWDSRRLRHVVNFAPPFVPTGPDPADDERFLFAGRLSAEKGIETLLQVVAMLSRGTLVVCGSGPLEEHVRRAARTSANGRIEYKGHVPHDILAQEMARCRFVVVPSEWFENAPFAVLEAMAAGRAVLASRIGGLPELVDDDTGCLVPVGDVTAWRRCLEEALEDPRRMQRLGQQARQRAQERYDFERHLDTVLEIYDEVLH
jgi:glycosyltransferase involved in cell wall biosynthesis